MEHIRAALSWVDLTIEQLVISLLILTCFLLHKRLVCITHKFNQLDKLVFAHALIINTKLGVKTIRVHRSADYEIAQPINDISADPQAPGV